ncbi:molybdopterin cofactor-binding domain-containing protein [Streptomyces sp. GD-15H]|uniref:molybdopterin cofactor-binding domain-containing protein n=1 Tax=Streptomyces sp. GD-15H TaxID=3129112 RepID=UPI00324E2B28
MIARVFSGDGFFKALNSHEAPLEAPCVFWEIGWAEGEVAPDTGVVTVIRLVVSGDMGRAANRLVARGQEEGAAVRGYGQALFEETRFENGVLINGEALDYRVPMAEDLPASFVSVSQEQDPGPGPFGSKGAGEGTLVPVAAAIANAVHDATGARITTPAVPDAGLPRLAGAPRPVGLTPSVREDAR